MRSLRILAAIAVAATALVWPGVYIECYLTGVSVTGPNGPTTIWDVVGMYQTPGGPLAAYTPGPFVVPSDAWIYTGSNDPVVPHC